MRVGTEILTAFAVRLAEESRRMLGKAAAGATQVEAKADNSFVTEVDRAIEERLRELIADQFPGHGVLGEEFGASDLDADLVWVLDPVDGTAAFVAGIPVYGTLVALARAGRPWIGVLDYPVTDDRWVGIADTYASRNGSPIRTRPCSSPGYALLTCSNPDFFPPAEQQALTRVRDRVRYSLYGASSYAFGLLASGRTDLSVDCGLKPYDVFAPAAVISGAGGLMTDWTGADLSFDTRGTVLAAGDRTLHGVARDLLTPP
ncbi:inositol monophosphatase family protein [Micromonospora sp. RTGN7]|uniref:inositol monophosphatase family protein n=1 Tax=Micromonospora sp. RTGN7 TaxID=3016526 RepID=UPI0029FF466A|nr:inositol monophosphatase family protein [Micromonospora sp. RTGN7]